MFLSVNFPTAVIQDTAYWAKHFAEGWRREVPLRIHDRDVSEGGTPDWHPSFERWLTRTEPSRREMTEKDIERLRTTKVMRLLRKQSPRSFEVLYRLLMLGESIEATTIWLNERAIRNEIPLPEGQTVHYRLKDTIAILIAGIAFAKAYF